jgi:hypothetical protein
MTTFSCSSCGSILHVAPRMAAGNGKWLFVSYEPMATSTLPHSLCSLECMSRWAQEELEATGKKLRMVVV